MLHPLAYDRHAEPLPYPICGETVPEPGKNPSAKHTMRPWNSYHSAIVRRCPCGRKSVASRRPLAAVSDSPVRYGGRRDHALPILSSSLPK